MQQAIHNLKARSEETGSVADLPQTGRPRSARLEENLRTVVQAFLHSPNKSLKRA
jgi:hypothetical protein